MCSVGWSCGVGRRSLVLRAFRPAAGSVADLCWGVERARRSQPLRRSLPFHPRHARLSTPLLIERWQMAGMGSSWGRHTVRLPSLDGVPVPDSCWLPTSPPPLGTGPGTRHRRPSAPRPGLGTAPRLSTERLQMAAMGSSWGRHTVRLPSLGGCRVTDSCRPSAPDPDLGTARAPQHRRPSALRPALNTERWQMAGMGSSWGRHTVRLPSLGEGTRRGQGEETGGAMVRDPAGPG